MTKSKVTGPFFSEEPTMTGDTFLTMVENTALCYVPVDEKRIAIPWPPRSPDLIPLDFFFWGFVKDIV
jgi:hypothetical protein